MATGPQRAARIPRFRPGFPHQGFSDQVNHNIIQSEIEGGVFLENLPEGATLVLRTENRRYVIEKRAQGQVLISGHPQYCPKPHCTYIHGSTWGGSMLKVGFIGRGMHLEFGPVNGATITTSRIIEIQPL